ncbi:CYP307A1 family protein [Megaselia abdita]
MFVIWFLLFIIFGCVALRGYFKVLHESIRNAVVVTKIPKSNDIDIRSYKQAPGPLPWPVLGNLAMLGQYEVPFEGFTELSKKYGDVYSLTLGTTRCLIVSNLKLIREVLNENGKFFGGRPNFIRYNVLFGGDRNNSLALCDWSALQQKRRNLARRHCSPRDASSLFQKMSDVGCFEMEEFMQKLNHLIPSEKKSTDLHIKSYIQQTCANMFSQYMCSVRFDYEDTEFQKIVEYFDEIFWEINQGYAVDFLPWLSPFYKSHMNKIMNWSSTIRKFILNRIINDREQNIDLDEPEKDFTDALLKSLVSDQKNVSRDTIIFMLEDFIGGHSAVGNLVMLALAYIVRYPEVGRRIQEEIDGVLGSEKRNVNLMDIKQMPYTVATVYEVLRYSSSPIVPHVATEDAVIAGCGVTAGTIVFINNYKLNTSEEYWENPKVFDPHRFLESNNSNTNKQRTTSFSEDHHAPEGTTKYRLKKNIPHFLPFSIGKRTCIGQNLVRGFGFIMLANIMREYNVTSKDLTKIHTYPACVALPANTFSLTLSHRF